MSKVNQALMILEIVEKLLKVMPEIQDFINQAKDGEEISIEEIERVHNKVNSAIDAWESAGKK